MKKFVFTSILLSIVSVFALSAQRAYSDSDHGNFNLRNGKVFFQKVYNHPTGFVALEKKLISYNNPNGGFQVKKSTNGTLNGVMINYNLNWNYKEMKTRKIEDFLKNPANSTFEVVKAENGYQVTINNIWFTDIKNPKNKNHLTLESIVTGKKGVTFTKDKKIMEALQMIDENFQWIFQVEGSTKDTRF